jgi:23S rRNA (pseudouridine1915-N3)-methyltransferase
MRIYVYFMGKPRDAHANAMEAEYLKRTSRYVKCESREADPKRFDPFSKHSSASVVALDPAGKPMDSPAFAAQLAQLEMEGRDLVFLIGGHDGLPHAWRAGASRLMALSQMTFPHELARAMLAEQIYRACATLRGHPYPR